MDFINEAIKSSALIKPQSISPTIKANDWLRQNNEYLFNEESFLVQHFDEFAKKDFKSMPRLTQRSTNELLSNFSQFYSSTDIDPTSQASKAKMSNLLANEYPELGYDYFYNNFDSFMKKATGYDATPDSYWEHLGSVLKSSSLGYISSADAFLTVVFNPNGIDDMLERVSNRAVGYRQDIGDKKWSNLFARSLTEAVAQTPNTLVSIAGLPLNAIPGVGTVARIASAGMIEAGSVMLDLISNGASRETALVAGLTVGVLNGTLEVYADDVLLKGWQRLFKGNKAVQKFTTNYIQDFLSTMWNDVKKAVPTEVATEMLQETVSMFAFNFATAFEQEFGRMEGVSKNSVTDFGNALWEVAEKTALGTPMITIGGDLVHGGFSYAFGGGRQAINASKVTTPDENSFVFQSKSIKTNEKPSNKYLTKKELKSAKADPIQVIQIGDEFYAKNPTDAQLSALKESSNVFAHVEQFSYNPDNVTETFDVGIDYNSAIDGIKNGFKNGELEGYSVLFDKGESNPTPENAKAIVVATKDAPENLILITLGDKKNIQAEFEEKVFGEAYSPRYEDTVLSTSFTEDVDTSEENNRTLDDYKDHYRKTYEQYEDIDIDDGTDIGEEYVPIEEIDNFSKVVEDDDSIEVETPVTFESEKVATTEATEKAENLVDKTPATITETTKVEEKPQVSETKEETVQEPKQEQKTVTTKSAEQPTVKTTNETKQANTTNVTEEKPEQPQTTKIESKRTKEIKQNKEKVVQQKETIEKATDISKAEVAKEVAKEISTVDPDNAVEKAVIVSTISKLTDKPEVDVAQSVADSTITEDPRFNLVNAVVDTLDNTKNTNRDKLRSAYNAKSLNQKTKKAILEDLELFKKTGEAPVGLKAFFDALEKASTAVEEHKEEVAKKEPSKKKSKKDKKEAPVEERKLVNVIKKKDIEQTQANEQANTEQTVIETTPQTETEQITAVEQTPSEGNEKILITKDMLKKKKKVITKKELATIKKEAYESLSENGKKVVDESLDKANELQTKAENAQKEIETTPKTKENIEAIADNIIEAITSESSAKEEQSKAIETLQVETTKGKDVAIDHIEEVKTEIENFNKEETSSEVKQRNEETIQEIEQAKEESIGRDSDLNKRLSKLTEKIRNDEKMSQQEREKVVSEIDAIFNEKQQEFNEFSPTFNSKELAKANNAFDSKKKTSFGIVKDQIDKAHHMDVLAKMVSKYKNSDFDVLFKEYTMQTIQSMIEIKKRLNNPDNKNYEGIQNDIIRFEDMKYCLVKVYENMDYLSSKDMKGKLAFLDELNNAKSEGYSKSNINEIFDDLYNDYVKSELSVLKQSALQGNDVIIDSSLDKAQDLMSSNKMAPFYEPYVYMKSNKYCIDFKALQRFFQERFAKTQSEEEAHKLASIVANFISFLDPNDIDSIMRKNNGRLFLDASETNIDIGDNRGATILESAQIILNSNADVTTVVHEVFHVLREINPTLNQNINEAVTNTLNDSRQELIEFMQDNALFKDVDADIKALELLGKNNLTEAEFTQSEESLARLYEAWFLSGESNALANRDSNLHKLFTKIADVFKSIYEAITGKAFVPDQIDQAFSNTLYRKAPITTDTTITDAQKGKVLFQSKADIEAGLNNPTTREDALEVVSNIIFYKLSSNINEVINSKMSFEDAKTKILESETINNYLKQFKAQDANAIRKTIEKRLQYIATSPSAYANDFGKEVKALRDTIGSGDAKARNEAASVVLSRIVDLWNSVRTKAKNSQKVLLNNITPLMSKTEYKKRTFNTETGKMETISYVPTNVLYRIVDSMKRTGEMTASLTPSEIYNLAKEFVTEDGKLVIADTTFRDGSYKSALATMLYYKLADTNEKITAMQPSSILDKEYVDTANLLIKTLQDPKTNGVDLDSNLFRLSNLLEEMGMEDSWLKSIINDDTDAEISVGILNALNSKMDSMREEISKLTEQEAGSNIFETLETAISSLENKLKNVKRREKNLADIKEVQTELKKANSEIERLKNSNEKLTNKLTEIKNASDVNALKKELAKAKNELNKWRNGDNPEAQKLQKKLDAIINSDEYQAMLMMDMQRKNNKKLIVDTLKSGDAYVARDLWNIFNALNQKKGTTDNSRVNMFDYEAYVSNSLYYPILDFMFKHNMVQIIDKDGKEYWNIVRSINSLSPSEFGELLGVFQDLHSKSLLILKERQDKRRAEINHKKEIITDSMMNIKGIDPQNKKRYIDEYFRRYHPESVEAKQSNEKTFREKMAESQFLLMTNVVREQSPELYAYLFGGHFDGKYNHNNLNTATNEEMQNVNRRVSAFINKISELFGVDAKNVNYKQKELFNKELTTLGTMSPDNFFNKYNVEVTNGISGREFTKQSDPRLIALYTYMLDIKEDIEVLESKIEKARQNLEQNKWEMTEVEIGDAIVAIRGLEVKKQTLNNFLYSPTDNADHYTMSDLMAIYMSAMSKDGLNNLLTDIYSGAITNNLGFQNVLYVMDQFLSNHEYKNYRELTDFMIEDIGSRYDPVNDVLYESENRLMTKEEMYFPIHHEQAGPQMGKTMTFDSFFSDNGIVRKGFTLDRTGAKSAVDFNLIDTYLSNIKKQEHFIAFKLITDEMTDIFSLNGDFARSVQALYQNDKGKAKTLITLFNDYTNAIKGQTYITNDIANIPAKLRNNYTVAKLCYNVATVMQQFPTYMLVANKIGWSKATSGLIEYMKLGESGAELVYNMSPQMRYRARLDTDTYKAYRNNNMSQLERAISEKVDIDKGIQAYRKTIDMGMGIIEKADRTVSNAMWYALYKSKLEEYSSSYEKNTSLFADMNELQKAAANEATQLVMDLIPSSTVKDNALAYSNRDNAIKEFLLFSNQLNKQFNMVYGDIHDFKNKPFKKAIGDFVLHDLLVLGAVSASAALISGAPLPDKEDDDKWFAFWKEMVYYTFAESLGIIPWIGTPIKEVITGTGYADTNIVEQINRVKNAIKKEPNKRRDHQLTNAIMGFLSELGTVIGAPSNEINKIYKTIINAIDKQSFGSLGYLVNTRVGNYLTSLF